jgi:4-amino-4-deoxy-L-arabinose transferase-like glycosyltransferase
LNRGLLIALVVVLALGLGLRVYFAVDRVDRPTPDAQGYALIAESLYEDGRYGDPSDFRGLEASEPSNYSPGPPLLVTAIHFLTGGVHPLLARLIIALIGAATVLLTYLIGRRLGGPWVGVVAAAPVAIYPILIEYHGMFMTEPLAAATLAGAVLAFLWAAERATWMAWALPGALLGLTALSRPEYLLIGFLFAVLAVTRAWTLHQRPRLVPGLVLLLALVLTILPWTIRNAIAFERFVPLSTGGGKALFIGTYLPGDGINDEVKAKLLQRPTVRRDLHLSRSGVPVGQINLDSILEAVARRRHPGVDTDAALSRMGRDNLREYGLGEPIEFAAMMAEKVWRMWRRGAGGPAHAVMREPFWTGFHAAVVVLGLAGLSLLAWRRRWEAAVLAAPILGSTAVATLLLASPRRNLPLIPLVSALAALAGVSAWHRVREGAG